MELKPLMYGYIRTELAAERLDELEKRILSCAEHEGFDLATIFREHSSDGCALDALIQEMRRAYSQHVIMPSLTHLDGMSQSRIHLLRRLRGEAGAFIWLTPQD